MTKNLCRWPGCQVESKGKAWACPTHWARLPDELRAELVRTFHPDRWASPGADLPQEYVAAAEAARNIAFSYNQTWNVFPGYQGGNGTEAGAKRMEAQLPRRRRRRGVHNGRETTQGKSTS